MITIKAQTAGVIIATISVSASCLAAVIQELAAAAAVAIVFVLFPPMFNVAGGRCS